MSDLIPPSIPEGGGGQTPLKKQTEDKGGNYQHIDINAANLHKGIHAKASFWAVLAFAAFECFGVCFWEIADGCAGFKNVIFHWLSLSFLVAGIFGAAHQIIEDRKKRWQMWILFIIPCFLCYCASYLIWCPPKPDLPQLNQTIWQPPELPPGCSNVMVSFGNIGFGYSINGVEMAGKHGKKFLIKDLPEPFTKGIEKSPNYSPRRREMWLKETSGFYIAGNFYEFPAIPYIESNRLYVEVQVPFSSEKQKVIMDDNFDSVLPIPLRWDRNYNTNTYFYEVVNELTNPVLQIIYVAPNIIQINGIFQESGNSVLESFYQPASLYTFTPKLLGIYTNQTNFADLSITSINTSITNFDERFYFNATDSPAVINTFLTNELYRATYPNQRRFYKYPSNEYPGVFNDWVTVMTTWRGTFVVNPTNRSELDPLPKTLGEKIALGVAYGTIAAGILWMGFGWIFYQKRSNV